MMKRFCVHVSMWMILAVMIFAPMPAFSGSPESDEPIKITLHDWTGQLVTSHLMGQVLQSMGYHIKYVTADYIAQFAGLESGDLHLAMEIWETTGKQAMLKSLATGKTEDLGETGLFAKEEWWYPAYMKEKCPGLPDWKALNKCAELFATPETSPKGRYLCAPVTWGGFDEERVKALGLNYEVVHAGTDAALFAELTSAYQRKAPILLWVYTPHWVPIKYKGEWIKFPEYTDKCYEDPSWGSNPKMAYDCGKPAGWIKKVAWAGLKDKWPGAHKAIKAFHIENKEMGEMIAKIDLDGEKLEKVVAEYLKTHEAVWKEWVK
ncbi:ABC transporter substrate-binding protein [Desulfospira joergensenii]|uniref:ABC transporter substrate-binding protein n=1 Tax=Desulfospira joergensenii TaxID=53329 RepID=UPI0003B68872|nr:ABC transporter substrate-binding protein [Desulfospira joergensenii]